MTKNFPAYIRHEDARCFNCGSDKLSNNRPDSGNAPGRGQFKARCSQCLLCTFYDLRINEIQTRLDELKARLA